MLGGFGGEGLGNFFNRERESLSEACGVLGGVWRERLGSFFHRESHRRELTERACQRRVGTQGFALGYTYFGPMDLIKGLLRSKDV